MKAKNSIRKIVILLLLICVYTTSYSQFPVTNKYYKKILKQDSIACYNLTISQKNKFDKDSSTIHAYVYYSEKEKPFGAKETYVDFIDYKYIYYKYEDSVFLFNTKTKKYYQSNLKTDSLLYYLNTDVNFNEIGPVLWADNYMPNMMSSKIKRFETDKLNCIGFSYTSLPCGVLFGLGFNLDTKDVFNKPCAYYSVIDTLNNCMKSLYMHVDTSKVSGDSPISLNYKFENFKITFQTNEIIKGLVKTMRKTYQLAELDRKIDIDFLKKDTNQIQREEKKETPKLTNESQKYDTPLETMNNTSVKLSDYKGKYILLDFWFINCPPCMMSVPKVDSLYERYKNKDFIIIGVNPFDKKVEALKDVINKRNMKYLICKSDRDFPNYFNVPYYPTYILISPDQKDYKKIEIHTYKEFTDFIKEMDKKLHYK